MSSFSFGEIDTSVKKKNINLTSDKGILLHSQDTGKSKHVLILLESLKVSKDLLFSIVAWTKQGLGPGFDFDIVASSNYSVTREQIKKAGVQDFYEESRSNFKEYIRPTTIAILTSGYALTAVTLNSDITVDGFYDVVFNKSYFYSPYTETTIVPIDSFDHLFKKNDMGAYIRKDNSRQQFAEYQLYQVKTKYEDLLKHPPIFRPKKRVVTSHEDWKTFYNEYKDHIKYPKVAWDTETSGFHFKKDRIGCISASFDGKVGWFIPWKFVNLEEFDNLISGKYQIFANGKFDAKFAHDKGIPNAKVYGDVVSLGQMLNEMRSNSLKSLAYYYTAFGGYDDELDRYKKIHKITNYLDIPEHIMIPYATMDAIVTFIVHEVMQDQLTALDKKFPPPVFGDTRGWSMRDYYERVRIPSINAFTKIEQVGVVVNLEVWDRNSDIVEGKIRDIKKSLMSSFSVASISAFTSSFEEFLPDDVFELEEGNDLKSGMKLGKILEAEGWPCYGRAKAGYYLTGDEQLSRWKNDGYAQAHEISNLRSYLVLQKTFLGRKGTNEGWRQYITYHEKDGTYRIHPTYGVMATESGRNSCSNPNWQQVPSGSLDAYLFKQIFYVPDPDKYLQLTIDKKAYQVRLCALDTGNETDVLYRGYLANDDLDLHSKTGYGVFAKGEKYTFVEINGKEYYAEQEVKVVRNGIELVVHAIDVQENDDLM